MLRLLAAALALLGVAEAAACPTTPGYKNLRYEEDYGPLADPRCRKGDPDAFKHLPIGSAGGYLSIGGEARARSEYVSRPDFGLDLAEDGVLLGRALLHADLHLNASVRAFVQAGSYVAVGRADGDLPTDEDRLDLAQGFIDLSADMAGGRATLRGGRQEATFGSARLVATRESPNVRRAFDGARLLWRDGALSVDAFYLQPIALGRGLFDDATDDTQALYGLYATLPGSPKAGLSVDLYYLGYRRDRARFAQGVAAERRHSLGIRLSGARGAADWDVEAVYQFGSFGAADLSAWTIASDLGLTIEAAPGRPRLGLKADVASGDGNLADDRLGTFNALYPKLPYFTEASIVAPANVIDLHPTIAFAPRSTLGVSFGANLLWRHRRADAFYAPPLVPIAALGSRSRYVGTQAEVGAAWQASRHVEVKAWYVHFLAGDAIERIGGSDVDFLATSVALKF